MIEKSDLHALADGELSAEEKAQLFTRLESDPSAQSEYQQIVALKSALLSTAKTPECDELWKSCRGRLDEIDKTKRVEGFVGKYAWGICGVFFLAIAFGGVLNRSMSRSVQPNDVAGYMAGLSLSTPRSLNQAEVNPALKQIIGEAFKERPPELRVTAFGSNNEPGRRTEFVQLSDAFGSVAVVSFIDLQEVGGLEDYERDSAFKCAKIDGTNAMFWKRSDGVICMVIGTRSYDELHDVIQALCSNSQSKG